MAAPPPPARRHRLAAALLAALAGADAGAGAAQDPDDALPQLLARHVASRGDDAAWSEVAAIEVRGTLGANGREHAVRLVRDRRGRARFESRYRELTRIFVDDGERGFLRDWRGEAFAPLDAATREQWLQDVDLLLSFPRYFERYARIESAGVGAAADGRELLVLRLVPAAGQVLELALDPATGRAEGGRYRYRDAEDGGTYEMQLMVMDQLEVAASRGSIRIPGYQEREQGTALTSWVPEHVELLAEVADRRFRP
ncbi:MAG TPA: hypothetical protein VMV46_06440 [Thermoanaerobaculia bacterium]|nr:hypothetical protein [Thermoanaerobaculia bacterium]